MKRNSKDPVLAREIPMFPWTTLEMDLFTLDSYTFLLVVDVTSRFPVVRMLNTEPCRSVLNALKGVYCDFGLRLSLQITDPASKQWILRNSTTNLVSRQTQVMHITSSLWDQMMKQIMTKNPDNAWLAMLIFKATDILGINKSPSESLNAKKYKTNLLSIN